jgi:hypothetical protein
MSDTIIDLDALVPPKVTIKLGGEVMEVEPPKVGDIMRLGNLGKRLSESEELSDEEVEAVVNGLTAQVQKCIPQLAGKEFTTSQLLKLVQIISEQATPPDTKELDKRGISADGPKAPSA